MPLTQRDQQPCRMVTLSGHYYTINGTFSEDPAQAVTSERWFLEMKAQQLSTATVIIRV